MTKTTTKAVFSQWTASTGPRITKSLHSKISDLHRLANTWRELCDYRTGTDPGTVLWSPFSPEAVNVKAVELHEALHTKHGGTITDENRHALATDLDAAIIEAENALPLIDKRTSDAEKQERNARQQQEDAARTAHQARAKAAISAIALKAPPGAKAAIVAELHEDASDPMSDYRNHRTIREVIIGFRMTDREDFKALRRAAAQFPETAHLGPDKGVFRVTCCQKEDRPEYGTYKGQYMPSADLHGDKFDTRAAAQAAIDTQTVDPVNGWEYRIEEEDIEHRENYSMGAGNYLKRGHRDSSGWCVKSTSWPMHNTHTVYEDGLPAPTQAPDSTPGTAPAQVQAHGTGYTIERRQHTKHGFYFGIVVLSGRVDGPTFNALRDSAKAAGGWYCAAWAGKSGGFAFKDQPTAQGEALAAAWAAQAIGGTDPAPNGGKPADSEETAQDVELTTDCPPCVTHAQKRREYSIVITTASHPRGVRHDDGGRGYTREEAITHLRDMVAKGRASDYTSKYGCYAEGPSERFTLADIDAAPAPAPVPGVALAHYKPGDRARGIADRITDKATRRDRRRNTPKQQCQAKRADAEADQWARTRDALVKLADLLDAGDERAAKWDKVSGVLVFGFMKFKRDERACGYYDFAEKFGEYDDTSADATAFRDLLAGPVDESAKKAREIQDKIDALKFANIPGYFPTPAPVVARMLELAQMPASGELWIIEPSAGSGNIADAIKAHNPDARVHCIERNYTLSDVLALKGYEVSRGDFMVLAHDLSPVHDYILMNPPFENGQDGDHIIAAYSLLKPGGRLVAVCSPGLFFRSDRASMGFRAWFYALGGIMEELPEGSFKESGTGVGAKLLVIDKPAD